MRNVRMDPDGCRSGRRCFPQCFLNAANVRERAVTTS